MTAQLRVVWPEGEPPKPASTKPTVEEVVAMYIAAREVERDIGSVGGRTIERLKHYLGTFAKDFRQLGDKQTPRVGLVAECASGDLAAWIKLHPEWDSGFTRQDAVASVVACWRWADDEGLVPRAYKRPKLLGKNLRPRPAITPEEYFAMRNHSRKALTRKGKLRRTRWAFRAALTFLWKTGCRPCEMREAEFDQIDWEKGIITLEENKTAAATGLDRLIPVRRVLRLLRWLHKHRRKGQKKIFANTLGRPWTRGVFAKEFRRYADLAGVRKKLSAYCLRHGVTVRLIEDGKSDRQIADVLGQVTTRYVQWYGRTSRTKCDHLNDILDGV